MTSRIFRIRHSVARVFANAKAVNPESIPQDSRLRGNDGLTGNI